MNCQYCNRPAKSQNSHRQHEIRCKLNPARLDMSYNKFNFNNPIIPDTLCQFCSKSYNNKIGLSNHIRRCPGNPNRVIEQLTALGRESIRQSTIKQNRTQWADPAIRTKHQESMRKAVENNPESYSSSNRGRTKQIIVDGIKLQGQWEVDFYKWARDQGLNPQRPTESFSYVWNGSRTYFPDFYIKSMDLYVEVKGYETDRDRAKWSQFPKKLRIIKEAEIKQIRQGCFVDL